MFASDVLSRGLLEVILIYDSYVVFESQIITALICTTRLRRW